jgi:phenylalanyl-tRNA synthetase beta subunit
VVERFVEKRQNDQIGMVVFGNEAFTQCPLTLDHGVVAAFLERIEIGVADIKKILESLEFEVTEIEADTPTLRVTVPDHRLDISDEPVTGRADLIEEIARIHGYDRVPVTEIADELPPQRNNPALDREGQTRDLLVSAGLQEVITYRLTTPEAEATTELAEEYSGDVLQHQFEKLEVTQGADEDLAALKAEMGLAPPVEAKAPAAEAAPVRVAEEENVELSEQEEAELTAALAELEAQEQAEQARMKR